MRMHCIKIEEEFPVEALEYYFLSGQFDIQYILNKFLDTKKDEKIMIELL